LAGWMRRLGQTAAKASARISRVLERSAVLLHGIAHAMSEKAGTLATGDGIPCLEASRLVAQTLVASSRVSRRQFGAALLPRRKVAVASRVVRVEGIRRIRLTRRAHYIASCDAALIAGGAPDRTSRRTTLSLVSLASGLPVPFEEATGNHEQGQQQQPHGRHGVPRSPSSHAPLRQNTVL
jgi:hypothetical protein